MAEVNIDCDGCLADFHSHIADWVDEQVKTQKVYRESLHYRFEDYMSEEQWLAAQEILNGSDVFWETLPLKPGAREVVDLLLNFGHDITVVTAPWWTYESWGASRYRWLQKFYGISPGDVVVTSKKWKVQGDVLIEDVAKNIQLWKEHHPQGLGILIPASYNVPTKNIHRRGWDKLTNWLLDELDELKARKEQP